MYGADNEIKNKAGESPYKLAMDESDQELSSRLKQILDDHKNSITSDESELMNLSR